MSLLFQENCWEKSRFAKAEKQYHEMLSKVNLEIYILFLYNPNFQFHAAKDLHVKSQSFEKKERQESIKLATEFPRDKYIKPKKNLRRIYSAGYREVIIAFNLNHKIWQKKLLFI